MPCVFTFADGSTLIPDTYTVATHSVTTEATQFPVQDGSTITDHVIVKPRTLSLDLIVSPLSPEPFILQPPKGMDRPLLAWNQLAGVASSRQPFKVEVDGQTYQPAVITNLNRQHVYDDGMSYRFTMDVQQVLIATAQTVPAAQVSSDIRHKTARKERGSKQATPADLRTAAFVQASQGNFITAIALGVGSVL